jgi:glycosyltransferase 2 family protein
MSNRAAPSAGGSSARQALLWILKIGVSAGLLYVLFTRIDLTKLWQLMRGASLGWIAAALFVYFVMLLVATWRWRVLLQAQHVHVPFRRLLNSYLAATFANNFLPSNIGGDVIRISDTAKPSGSKTLAAAVVLADRFVGVLGLAFIAACGSAVAAQRSDAIGGLFWAGLFVAVAASAMALIRPEWLGALAKPLRVFHAEWVDRRIATIISALHRFRQAPGSLAIGFGASIVLQALLVVFYAAVATAIHLRVPIGHMAILVPLSSLVQMAPVSLNGHGVRETTFVGYLTRIGVQRESAFALSIIGAALVMLFSMTGAAAYLARRQHPAPEEAETG